MLSVKVFASFFSCFSSVNRSLYTAAHEIERASRTKKRESERARKREREREKSQKREFLHGENFTAIFTTLSVVIWFSTGTLGIFATLFNVFTMRVII